MSRLGDNGKGCAREDSPACRRLMLLERDLAALVAEWREARDQTNDNLAALQSEVARMGDAVVAELREMKAHQAVSAKPAAGKRRVRR